VTEKPPKRPTSKTIIKKWREIKPLLANNRWLIPPNKSPTRSRYIASASQIPNQKLRILTFNIQAGLNSQAYSDYIKATVSQFLPSLPNMDHINAIGDLIAPFDVIALQELDGGSVRSGHLNQLSYLAQHGGFEFWHQQLNRNLGKFGQYSNGILSRFIPFQVDDHRLPGLPGRGAIIAKYSVGSDPESTIAICCVHLALSVKARNKQLGFIRDLLAHEQHIVLLGDMNCIGDDLHKSPIGDLQLQTAPSTMYSYPSWEPRRSIDHILVSKHLKVTEQTVICSTLSDHCPITTTIEIPLT